MNALSKYLINPAYS